MVKNGNDFSVDKMSVDEINIDKILIRLLLRKLGYDEKVIDNVCEIIGKTKIIINTQKYS